MIWILEAQRCGGGRGAHSHYSPVTPSQMDTLYEVAAKITGFYWILKGKLQEGSICREK